MPALAAVELLVDAMWEHTPELAETFTDASGLAALGRAVVAHYRPLLNAVRRGDTAAVARIVAGAAAAGPRAPAPLAGPPLVRPLPPPPPPLGGGGGPPRVGALLVAADVALPEATGPGALANYLVKALLAAGNPGAGAWAGADAPAAPPGGGRHEMDVADAGGWGRGGSVRGV
jgi:hypothetical protein